MTEFGYILIILFEIMAAFFIIWGLIFLEKKVKCTLLALCAEAEGALNTIKNVNLKLKIFNENFRNAKRVDWAKIKQIVLLAVDIVNFILLIRSMDFKKGKRLSFKNLKKLVPFSLVKKVSKMF